MKLAHLLGCASALAVMVVGSCSSPKLATLNAAPPPVTVPRREREPALAYVRTEVTRSSAPELEPDWHEDILELRNATTRSFRFSTVFDDGFSGTVDPAETAAQDRWQLGHCGNALRSRLLAPGESFVMHSASRIGRSRAWMNVWDVATNEQITLVSDEYDSGAAGPVVRARCR